MSITLMWYVAKRIPKYTALILNFIVIFLTIFLLVGCYNENNKSTFLVSYKFNQQSPFYTVIKDSFKTSGNNTVGLEKVKVTSGYMGVCVENIPTNYDLNGQQLTEICYPRKNITNVPLFNDLSIEMSGIGSSSSSSSNSNSTSPSLNILKLGQLTSVNVMHPYILMSTVILAIIQFLTITFISIPNFPFKDIIKKFLLVLSLVLTLIWGMGSIWVHIGIHASYRYIPEASWGIIKVHKGRKSASMTWFAFAFLLITSIMLWVNELKNRRSETRERSTMSDTKNHPDYYSSSDSSSIFGKV